MKTRITELLGIEYPIIQGGMAWVAEHHLAAAVSEAARDDRRNRRRIGGRAADPQLFKPFDQRRLAVTRRTLRETLQRRNAFRLRPIPLFQRGQQRLFALLRLVFGRFGIQFHRSRVTFATMLLAAMA